MIPSRASSPASRLLAPAPKRMRLGNVNVETAEPDAVERPGSDERSPGRAADPCVACFVMVIEGIGVKTHAPERSDSIGRIPIAVAERIGQLERPAFPSVSSCSTRIVGVVTSILRN